MGKSQSTASPSSPGDSTLLVFIVITVLMSVIGGAGLIYEHQIKIKQGKPSILQKLQKFLEETRKKIQKDE